MLGQLLFIWEKKVVTAIKATQMPLKASAFEGMGIHFTMSLPAMAAYGPSGPRDFDRVEGLLGYVCDVVNAQRDSVTFGLLQQRVCELTELLEAAVEGRLANPSDEFLSDIESRFEKGVEWGRRLERTKGGATFRTDARITSGDASHALLAVLLMDPEYRQLIRRCPQCGNFFIRAGKRVFCGSACATAANDAGVLQRQKKQNLRRKAQALLPPSASVAKRAAAVKQAHKDHPDVATAEQLAEYARPLVRANLIQPRKHK
jgi:predicted RNA-binding Zn ribbon-like protein